MSMEGQGREPGAVAPKRSYLLLPQEDGEESEEAVAPPLFCFLQHGKVERAVFINSGDIIASAVISGVSLCHDFETLGISNTEVIRENTEKQVVLHLLKHW